MKNSNDLFYISKGVFLGYSDQLPVLLNEVNDVQILEDDSFLSKVENGDLQDSLMPRVIKEYELDFINISLLSTLNITQLSVCRELGIQVEGIDLNEDINLILTYPFGDVRLIYKVKKTDWHENNIILYLLWLTSKLYFNIYSKEFDKYKPYIGFGSLDFEGVAVHDNNTISFMIGH